jgi:hypothetical protein
MNIKTFKHLVIKIRFEALTAVSTQTVVVSPVTPCSLPGGHKLLEGHAAFNFRSKFDIENGDSMFFRNDCVSLKAYTMLESSKHHSLRIPFSNLPLQKRE